MSDNLNYWNDPSIESMYDKHLLRLEIEAIDRHIPSHCDVLDVGCGEGEGTLVYAQHEGVIVHGIDFSDSRLVKARHRLAHMSNVDLTKIDMLGDTTAIREYDRIISQRFLINLPSWKEQRQTLRTLVNHLYDGGKLLLLEGSKQGTDELNELRVAMGLDPIPVRWHNVFIDDIELHGLMIDFGMTWVSTQGFGEYFALTRGIAPAIDSEHIWETDFNRNASSGEVRDLFNIGEKFSRLKLWTFIK